MQLPGRLKASTLGDLLGLLHRHRTTGTLELLEVPSPTGRTVPGRLHRIHLVHGLVTAVDTGARVPPIGEVLRREGFLGAGEIGRLLRHLADGDARPAGEILIAEAAVSADVIDAGLRAQLRDKIEALYEIEDAQIGFRPPRPSPAGRRSKPLSPSDFLHGRARARDRRTRASAEARPRSGPESSPGRFVDPAERARALTTLGLSGSASPLEIRRAFRRLASELHPDRYPGDEPDARQRRSLVFARVTAAYHRLV